MTNKTAASRAIDLRPGDVIRRGPAASYAGDIVTLHDVRESVAGMLHIRYRYTSNPRGIDWSGVIRADERPELLSRGVARVDTQVRTMLPAPVG